MHNYRMAHHQMPYNGMMNNQMPHNGMMNNQMPNAGTINNGMMNNGMMPHHDNHKKLKDYVKEHMLNYVMVELKDGKTIDGIIEEIDGEHVYLLVPAGDEEQAENNAGNGNGNDRQFGFGPGFGYGGFGPGFGYGFGGYGFPGRFRYFRRRRFPFYGIRRFYPPYFY